MNLHRCPYDGTPVDAESYSGGSFLLTCSTCGAEWEAHNTLVRRVTGPDWDAARRARSADGAPAQPSPPQNAA